MNLAAYLLLFLVVGAGFILVNLLVGKLFRPDNPAAEKGTIYECGEPTIGSAWVQFDLRFYVVALLFVIFDVEVAFFFPWAEVFGKANAIAAYGDGAPAPAQLQDYGDKVRALIPPSIVNRSIRDAYANPEELGNRLANNRGEVAANSAAAHTLAVLALGEIVVFFGVLLVGFAYLWRRGDLEWVRSLAERAGQPTQQAMPPSLSSAAARAMAPAPPVATSAGQAH